MTLPNCIRLLLLALIAAVHPACEVGSSNTGLKAGLLSGRQQVPPVTTTATGSATLTVDAEHTQVTVTLEVSGLVDITMAHLHFAKAGVNGPILFTLASGTFASPLTVTLTSAALLPVPGIATFDDALQAMTNGDTYVDVHTMAHAGGEIRGQVGRVSLSALLDGTSEIPSVSTAAAGSMTVSLSNDQSAILLTLSSTGLGDITAAAVHAEAAGIPGPILFVLSEGPYASPLTVMLTAGNLTPQPSKGVSTFAQAVDALLAGFTYVEVSTMAHPDGEIRGQILP